MLRLQNPSLELFPSYLDYLTELVAEDYSYFNEIKSIQNNAENYLKTIQEWQNGLNLPTGFVSETRLWLTLEDQVLGVFSIRHRLNSRYLKISGHIGYSIIPSRRRNGYATAGLKLTLDYILQHPKLDLKRVLITCDSDNIASKKVIEKCGGVLENKSFDFLRFKVKLRFWIDLKS